MRCPAHPTLGEREVAAASPEHHHHHHHHLIPTGQIPLADKDVADKEFNQLTDTMGLHLPHPDRKDHTYPNGNPGGLRQWIESVNQTLQSQLDLQAHDAQTSARGDHPHRPAPAGHDHRDLTQPDHQHHQQTITDRLRPLPPTSRNHSSRSRGYLGFPS